LRLGQQRNKTKEMRSRETSKVSASKCTWSQSDFSLAGSVETLVYLIGNDPTKHHRFLEGFLICLAKGFELFLGTFFPSGRVILARLSTSSKLGTHNHMNTHEFRQNLMVTGLRIKS